MRPLYGQSTCEISRHSYQTFSRYALQKYPYCKSKLPFCCKSNQFRSKKKERNVGVVFGRVFLKTAANGYLKMIHSYSRFSLGTHRDHSQLHRMSGSGFSRFFLYIFANLYCLYLENKTFFRKSGSVTLHHLSPSNFIQKRGKICLAVSEILRANY